MYMSQPLMNKETMNLKERKEGYVGGFGGRKRTGKLYDLKIPTNVVCILAQVSLGT